MPIGTCDPASRGATWNEGEQDFGAPDPATGRALGILTYRYGWDGVSTRETGCVGPLNRVTVLNGNPETWYAHFQGRRGQWRRIDMAPGFSRTYNQSQLRNAGFEDNTDLENLTISTDPSPPQN